MEKSLEIFEEDGTFAINDYSPLTLAFLGDSVYELFIRSNLVKSMNTSPDNLHKRTVKYVKAKAQCDAYDKISDVLNEQEIRIFKRGRNAKVNSRAKNADLADYKKATGFEALVGYLYLKKDNERLYDLLKKATNFE